MRIPFSQMHVLYIVRFHQVCEKINCNSPIGDVQPALTADDT